MTEETEASRKTEKLHSKTRDKPNKKDKAKPLTKVVIRRLPPTMSEEDFLKQIEPLPDNEFYYYVPADWSLGYDATCRAYINFTNPNDIFLFKDRFDGYVFVDNKGAEYPAVVEFAPFQGLPRNKSRKRDPKCNTIETDPHYLSFLESLKEEENAGGKSEIKLEFSLQSKEDKKITSTPLLQYLANKKQERRDERKRKIEEKRRQREDERQRKRNQITKTIPPIKEEESKVNKESISSKGKEKDRQEDSKRDAKAKRRAVRDLKRKMEREKRNALDKNSEDGNHEKSVEKSDSREKFAEKEDEKKKEVKKYSQTRKSRNEIRKGDISNNSATENKETRIVSKEKDTQELREKVDDSEEISESVKEFIKSVAKIKEFIPRSRTIVTNADLESSIKAASTVKNVDMGEVREKLEQIAVAEEESHFAHKIQHKNEEVRPKSLSQDNSPDSGGARDSSCSGTDRNEKEGRKDKDNRHAQNIQRIRNKDRPSIQIYQPGKLRQKKEDFKDGRSSAELKDYKSNPTSDCESIKKEKEDIDGVRRKVSRYSERRSSRAKEKSVRDEKQESHCKESTSSILTESGSTEKEIAVEEENIVENS